MAWLEWDGWDGIAGIVALIALAAALVVTYVELRAWYLAPNEVSVEANVYPLEHAGGVRKGNIRLRFRFHVVAPSVLHEVEIIRNGGAAGAETLGRWHVLDAEAGFVEVDTDVPRSDEPYAFIVTWLEATRFGPRRGSAAHVGWQRGRV